MAWAGLGDICSAEGGEGWVGMNCSDPRLVLRVYTDIPGGFCASFGWMLRCRGVLGGSGAVAGAAAGACRAGGAGGSCRTSHEGRFLVGCRSCGASPAQPGVPGALVCCGRDRVHF